MLSYYIGMTNFQFFFMIVEKKLFTEFKFLKILHKIPHKLFLY